MKLKERIETRVQPQKIWEAWEKAHAIHGGQTIFEGAKGVTKSANAKGFRYQVLDVVHGERFSILWKTLFVRLIFSHQVVASPRGSEVCYSVQIKGFFALPVRFFLGNKIQKNISLVLKTLIRQLETEEFSLKK